MNPQVIRAIAQAVVQSLQVSGVWEVGNKTSVQTKLKPNPHVTPSRTPQPMSRNQPVPLVPVSPSLSRRFSIGSVGSTQSSSSFIEESEESQAQAHDYDTFSFTQPAPPKKRNKKTKYLPGDKVVVNVPVMQLLDATYLAPEKSPLFSRRFRQKNRADGTKVLKKEPSH